MKPKPMSWITVLTMVALIVAVPILCARSSPWWALLEFVLIPVGAWEISRDAPSK